MLNFLSGWSNLVVVIEKIADRIMNSEDSCAGWSWSELVAKANTLLSVEG